jgi:hypothetical protein
MIQINLVPDVKQQLIKAQEMRSKVINISIFSIFAAAGIVASLLVYAFAVQTVVNSNTDKDISAEESKLSNVTDLTKILTIQNQLKSISSVNTLKKINSRIFDMITTLKINGNNTVSYSSISLDEVANTVQINGQTATYQSYDTFKKTLLNAQVQYKESADATETKSVALASNVSLPETSYGIDSTGKRVLTFTINFSYNTMLLDPTISDVKIEIIGTGNVSDSYLGVPTSLFSDKATSISGGQ